MSNFKKVDSSNSIDSRFLEDRAIVYLESSEDYEIMAERWFFDKGDLLEFKATDKYCKSGGCEQVKKLVKEDREKRIKAFGILDRDVLLKESKLDILLETDDSKYKAMKPFGNYIYILCRWEIENYLIEPSEILNIIKDRNKEKRPNSEQELISELLNHIEILIPIMAGNIILHKHSRGELEKKFAIQEQDKDRTEQKVRGFLENKRSYNAENDELNLYIKKIEKFSDDHQEGSRQRFDSLIRIIDGKRFIDRIQQSYKLHDEMRFSLATRIREHDKIPKEIIEFIEEITTTKLSQLAREKGFKHE